MFIAYDKEGNTDRGNILQLNVLDKIALKLIHLGIKQEKTLKLITVSAYIFR